MDYSDVDWFALEMNQDDCLIFEIACKYCLVDSFVEYEGYYTSCEGLLTTVIDIMVI